MPHGELVRQQLIAHVAAGGVVLGESAGHHGASKGVAAMLSPMSENATLALATGLALAGKAVVVEILDPAGLGRAADALADLRDLAPRSDGSFAPTVVVCVPGGTVFEGAFVAGRERDAAEQLAACLSRGGVSVLIYDHDDGAEELSSAPLGEPVLVREGRAITVLASGSDLSRAVAAAVDLDARVVEVRGPADLSAHIRATGRAVLVGEIPLGDALNAAFWSLEAPLGRVPHGADPAVIRLAIQTVLGA